MTCALVILTCLAAAPAAHPEQEMRAAGAEGPVPLRLTAEIVGEDAYRVTVEPAGQGVVQSQSGRLRLESVTTVLTLDQTGTDISVTQQAESDAEAASCWRGSVAPCTDFGRAAVDGLELRWHARSDEAIYGLGERFDGLDQAGKAVEMWIRDAPGAGADLRDSYFCTPVVYSSAGYGLFAADNPEGMFDFNSGGDGVHRYWRGGRDLTFYLVFADNLKALVRLRGAIAGPFRGVPDWAWGPWISRNSYETQAEAQAVLTAMAARDLPVAAIVQEAWKGRSEDGAFHDFSRQRWPAPEAYFDLCREMGVETVLWQAPILHPHSPHFARAAKAGWFVTDTAGQPRLRRHWLPGFANIDFTHPQAVAFWQGLMGDEVRRGVRGFKADDGEDVAATDVFADGRRGWQMHNAYSTLYNQALFDLFDEAGVTGMIWARSGSLGIERCPALWAGDQYATWAQLRSLVPAGLSTSISGMPFWGHDIGGYIDTPTPELYVRWLQFGAFSPLMQYHGVSPREPWHFGPTAEAAYGKLARIRMALRPTLIALGQEAADTGMPIMRPMTLEFPNDDRFLREDTQYLLGPDLLVAPVMQAGAAGRYLHFPEGSWRHLLDPVAYDGPCTAGVAVDLLNVPVFVRDGAQLAVELDPGAALSAWRRGAPVRTLRYDAGDAVLRNLHVPVEANALSGLAEITFEYAGDPRQLRALTGYPGSATTDQRVNVRCAAGRCTVALVADPESDVRCLAQPFAIERITDDDAAQLVARGAVRWTAPITLSVRRAGGAVTAGEPAEIVATAHNRCAEPVTVTLAAMVQQGSVDGLRLRQVTVPPRGTIAQHWRIDPDDRDTYASIEVDVTAKHGDEVLAQARTFVARPMRWIAVGPFPAADAATAHATVYGPEWLQGPEDAFATSEGEIRWRRVPDEAGPAAGGVDFAALYGPRSQAAAYALTRLHSAAEQDVELRLGSDDTLAVWVNGSKVYDEETYRLAAWDQAVVPVRLQAGMNTILIKVAQDRAGWRALVRLTGRAGGRLAPLCDGFDDYAAYAADRPAPADVHPAPERPSWRLSGPYPRNGIPAAAETAWVAAMTTPGDWPPPAPVAWRSAAPGARVTGAVNLLDVWEKQINAYAYAAGVLHVDVATPVEVVAGSDDGMALWLNGERLIDADVSRPYRPDAHRVRATLRPGENRVLVRIGQDGGDWMFRVAVWDLSSRPPRLLTWR